MTTARLSISSWSLHRLLGKAWYETDADGEMTNRCDEMPKIELLDVPGEARRHGIGTVEFCHFHFPSTEQAYLGELNSAIDAADIELFSILIDTGDISAAHETERTADLKMMRRWIDVAATLGAGHVRIIAGDQAPAEDAILRSVDGLLGLTEYAKAKGVRTLTENFKQLAARPEVCLEILARCHGEVGLCADFGNFPEQTRTRDLAAVLPQATSIHAKAEYVNGEMDREAYIENVELSVTAGFDGPLSLIYQDTEGVWDRLEEMKVVTEQVWMSRGQEKERRQ
ncbi:MAG TPA: xylose isomerase [Candidatus Latescibacteria bacterium]|nr:xylose isomerase [Candidatus Latescibacterota bacterium]|tara:strand:- start:2470 stop:3321 length:852 start_codon:yes stop_codon:yes gene_type:complete